MKKVIFLLPVVAVIAALSSAFISKPKPDPDLVWFQVNSMGQATSPTNGTRSDTDPFSCPGGTINCSRALSISEGEASLNSGSSTVYHINSGYNTVTHYNAEAKKN